ncbi:benzoquinone reductase [Tulasnella calospora MUT 4182]|uniref:Benzoquinone reductase n=1 Tax=Tulasnella calospora MUT 4182 TaxID=1051891 RepID=A0A0C3MK01_9AGAM|nr:benzoquinone reductase [Tulasnella calospora MUT 4182]
MTKLAVIYYSLYGHCKTLADRALAAAKADGADAEIYQVPETLSEEIRTKMHAPPKADDPVITPDKLTEFDGYIFVIPTRYGRAVSQFSAFFDATGGLWMKQRQRKFGQNATMSFKLLLSNLAGYGHSMASSSNSVRSKRGLIISPVMNDLAILDILSGFW